MGNGEIEKGTIHITVQIVEYIRNAVLSKTIIKKATGNITATAVDAGEELPQITSPFDNYIQVIDGIGEVTINNRKYTLRLGEGIIIPAHSTHSFNANEQFKMISTIIKSGYDE